MKHYAVEVDFQCRRRVTTARYATRAEARDACNRHAPLFKASIVVIRAERARAGHPAHSHTAQVPA